MHRRRALVHRAHDEVRERAHRLQPADRSEPGRAVSDRARVREHGSGGSDALSRGREVRPWRAVRRRGKHGEAARGRRVGGGGERRRPDARRIRICGGVRRRAQVPRNAPVSGGAHLDKSDSRVRRRARARITAIVLKQRKDFSRAMAPLNGITVVAVEQAVAAPFATRQLADLGARVIKIERPDGGDFARGYDAVVKGQSSYFVWLNRAKQSLTLDLKRPEGMGVLSQLVAKADVFVQNLAPGAADRLGTSAAALCAKHPRLIACNISGYGTDGPYADKKAYDLLVQAETGLVSITGTPEVACKAGISVADIAAGMYACSGILAALFARATSGRGTPLDVSLFDALGEWMGAPMYHAAYGEPLERTA